VVCLAPRALEEIVRPRRLSRRARRVERPSFELSAACGISRPLNFPVRNHGRAERQPEL
jgi:hypothetical protein